MPSSQPAIAISKFKSYNADVLPAVGVAQSPLRRKKLDVFLDIVVLLLCLGLGCFLSHGTHTENSLFLHHRLFFCARIFFLLDNVVLSMVMASSWWHELARDDAVWRRWWGHDDGGRTSDGGLWQPSSNPLWKNLVGRFVREQRICTNMARDLETRKSAGCLQVERKFWCRILWYCPKIYSKWIRIWKQVIPCTFLKSLCLRFNSASSSLQRHYRLDFLFVDRMETVFV